jgi:hypothetical protein
MQVSKEILTEWSELKEKGDNLLLAKLLKITPQNVSRITRSGVCSLSQVKIITKFFNNKKAEIAKYADDNN